MKKRAVYLLSGIIYLVIVMSITLFHYEREKEKNLQVLDTHLERSAWGLDYILGLDFHDKYNRIHRMTADEYKAVKLKLNDYTAFIGMDSVYTMVMEDGIVYLVVINETEEDVIQETDSLFMNPYPDPPGVLFELFTTDEIDTPVFSEYTNNRDSFYSVFIPKISPGGIRYLLAADVKRVNRSEILSGSILWNLLLSILLLIPIISAFVYIRYREHKQQEELSRQLYTDKLTGLPNRSLYIAERKSADTESEAAVPMIHSMIMLDIDSFRGINNLFGFATGDKVLLQMGEYIQKELPEGWILYKFPADEFVILIPGNNPLDRITGFAEKILEGTSETIFIPEGQGLDITISVGISYQPENQRKLLAQVNLAKNFAKQKGLGFFVYNESINLEHRYAGNYIWLKKLKEAIREKRLKPFYQPILNLETNRIDRYEALIRIIDRDGTVIPPFRFLEVAKMSKLYREITSVVIREAVMNFRNTDLKVSVNLSVRDLTEMETVASILNMAESHGMEKRLTLEILESESILEYETVQRNIQLLRDAGISIAIDDFGSGYSNFHYLGKFGAEIVKIDGSIIKNLGESRDASALTAALCRLADEMGFEIVAEYVADENILERIKDFGITHAQGYHIGKPVPFEEIVFQFDSKNQ